MPSYSKVIHVPGKTADELFVTVSRELDHFLSKTPIGHYELVNHETRHAVEIQSKMFSGTLVCSSGKITLDAKLSLMAAPFKGKLDEGIDRWIAKTFKTL